MKAEDRKRVKEERRKKCFCAPRHECSRVFLLRILDESEAARVAAEEELRSAEEVIFWKDSGTCWEVEINCDEECGPNIYCKHATLSPTACDFCKRYHGAKFGSRAVSDQEGIAGGGDG